MIQPNRRRVVITGIGAITPCGLTRESFWDSIVRGESAAGPLTHFDTSAMPCKIACEVRGFDPVDRVGAAKARRLDPAVLFAIAASREALEDSGLDLRKVDPDRIGVVEGTSVCGLTNSLEAHARFLKSGHRGILPTRTVSAFAGGGSSEIALEFGLLGQATTITTACSSGNDAMAYAAGSIQNDLQDVVIAGADEAPIVGPYYSLFINAGVLSRHNADPAGAMRPFDRDRDGFVIGEGAVFLVMEELTHALARGARIYAEWSGYGQSCDAFSSINTHPEGRGMRRSIERAFFNANLPVDSIDYVNAHGSATDTNELIETQVYKAVFGSHAAKLAVSATKPVTGHLMGGVAAVEAAVCALSIHNSIIPPTANLAHPMAGCDLDYVPGAARNFPVRHAMNVNLGFGGKSSAIILSRYTEQ
jgi:3-oxoacyl-[acyl-carrier-protein] synthase II